MSSQDTTSGSVSLQQQFSFIALQAIIAIWELSSKSHHLDKERLILPHCRMTLSTVCFGLYFSSVCSDESLSFSTLFSSGDG